MLNDQIQRKLQLEAEKLAEEKKKEFPSGEVNIVSVPIVVTMKDGRVACISSNFKDIIGEIEVTKYKTLITEDMIAELNTQLKDRNACLKYMKSGYIIDDVPKFTVVIDNEFIDKNTPVVLGSEAEKFIREFFEKKNLKLLQEDGINQIWGCRNAY